MNGVIFGAYHSWDDFSLVLSPDWEVEAPAPKTEIIELPGGDGVLDFTEAFGEVKYNNRAMILPFTAKVSRADFWKVFSKIQNSIHGKKLEIILEDDPEFYYVGRVTVDRWKADRNIGTITITCDCEPYKYKRNKTVIKNTVTNTATIVYPNLKRKIIPEITLTADATIEFEGNAFSFKAGTSKTENIIFGEGDNVFKVTGNTTITVTYQEGGF